MTCLEFRSILDRYVDRELSTDEMRRADEHLTGCATCREELASQQSLKQLMSGYVPPVQPPDDYWDQARDRVLAKTVLTADREQKQTDTLVDSHSYMPVMRSVLSVAASIALLAIALVLGSRHDRPAVVLSNQPHQVIVTAEMAELLKSPDGGPLTLGDQRRIGQASILMGGPGMVGRFNFLPGLLRIY
ncbi:MAG: zf-HC2 domain-containing protein [candidate division Zixibacteria bacterium]|nr:zf-HC2 domain-containing protein [candidate division Zixibacteria bacterium]